MLEACILLTSTPQDVGQLEDDKRPDIVVTGERIARSSHETASSLAVETESSIEDQANPDRIEQILQAIPNVQLGSGGEGPTIRGQDSTGVVRDLPAFLSGTRPRTTMRIDGRSATYYELAFGLTSIADVNRIEVFRSPQTTTQGRNSIAGAIFVETNDPTFEWEGRGRLVLGNYATRHATGAVSGPIASDQLAFRLSGDLRRSNTASKITNAAEGIDPNRDDSQLIRLKLLAEPDGLPDARLSLAYSHGHSQMPQIEGVRQPFSERRDPNATYGIFAVMVDSLTGRFEYLPAGGFEARATVSYGIADVRRYAPDGLGEADIDTRDFSIEPILTFRSRSGVFFTGGANFTHAKLNQAIDLSTFGQVLGSGSFADSQNSLGIFSEVTVPFTTALSLTAGLRYQRDRQVRQGALIGSRLNLPLAYDQTFSEWLPKVSLALDISTNIRVGALVQRATNPGGVNLNTARVRIETFGAEQLWDFEIFARARLADGKLVLSSNLFRYEMVDAQRTQAVAVVLPNGQVITSPQIDNAPRAWSMGIEADFDWRPSQSIQLRGAIGLLDTRITRTLTPIDPMLGKQFQRSPHLSASASLVWMPTGPFTFSAQVRHNSSYFSDDLETTARRIEGSTTIDIRAARIWRGVTWLGYVRNLLDEFHLTYRFDPTAGLATAGDPREFGLGIEARF